MIKLEIDLIGLRIGHRNRSGRASDRSHRARDRSYRARDSSKNE